MHSSYQAFDPAASRARYTHRTVGLTSPSVIEAYVNRRISDPALLSAASGPSYADFFQTV